MTPHDLRTIQEHVFQAESRPVVTTAVGKGDTGKRMTEFCEALKRAAPHIKIKKKSDLAFEEPVMAVGSNLNIAYYAIPAGKILPLFLKALDRAQYDDDTALQSVESELERIDLPVSLKLYVSGHCPHCPTTISQLQTLAAGNASIRLRIIDAGLFPEKARRDKIQSVPTLILDDAFRWTGSVSAEELIEISLNRDPSQLSTQSLRQLTEDGQAQRLAGMMTEHDRIFPAFIELVAHPRWSVRLGAMVCAEYLAEESPPLGLDLCRLLWERFPGLGPQVQGDVIHVLGLVDSTETRAYLQSILSGNYDAEVKEAAAEVMEEMGA